MKNNKLILSAGVLAIAMASCTDLEVEVESQYTEPVGAPAAVQANLNNIYFQFRDPLGRRYMEAMTLTSDEYTSLAFSGNWVDGYAYAHPTYHNQNPSDATVDWMGNLGRANVLANEVVQSDAKEEYKAAARAMRAFFTFIIMENWGDTPIADTKFFVEHPDLNERNRVARPLVAQWIASELEAVKDVLPEETTGENYGKPSKYMALALLAKLYINWPVYTAESVDKYEASAYKNEKLDRCIAVCDEIIKAGKFELGPDPYRFKFNWDNSERVATGKIKDFIYAAPYDTKEAQGMQWGRSHVYKDVKKMDPSMFGEFLNNSGGAYMALTPECVSNFNLPGDQRNFMIAGLCDPTGAFTSADNENLGQVYVYDPETLLPTEVKALDRDGDPLVFSKNIKVTGDLGSVDVGDDKEGWRQGYRSMKWFLCNNDYSNGRNQSNDVPIFRYADILLTKAEALVRGGKGGAKDLFNQIRTYVEAPVLEAEPTLNDIYCERGREFFDELWRRNDMIRFGHYEDEFFPHYKDNPNASFDKTHRLFPISQNDLNVNDGWEQNPGY